MNHSLNSTTRSSQAAVFLGPGRPLELQHIPVPEVARGEALVRMECCTMCGSDFHTITGARHERFPSILGHEAVGFVSEVGLPAPKCADGSAVKVGDRVTWSVVVACGSCDRCIRGLTQKCRQLTKYGHELAEGRTALSGGLSEYILLQRGSGIVRVDHQIPREVICPANCATATVMAAYRVAELRQSRRVLIMGAGMLGLTATAYARFRRTTEIVVCDPDPKRLDWARRFGATITLRPADDIREMEKRLVEANQDEPFDLVLEMSGAPGAVEMAIELAGIGATIVLVGSVKKSRPVSIDPERIVRRLLTMRGMHNYQTNDLLAAVDFLSQTRDDFPWQQLVESTVSLNQIDQAVENAIRDRPVRLAVVPS